MKLTSSIAVGSEAFRANEAANLDALRVVKVAADHAALGGGQGPRERHESRGKMLPRDRVANLLDPGSPLLEVGATAAHGLYDGAAPCAGVIAGIGLVAGRQVMVVCNDATVKGGTYYPMTVKKHLRAQEIAEETTCLASTWWTLVVRTYPIRTRSSPTATILGAFSTIRPACRQKALRRSQWSWAPVRQGGPMCPPCPTSRSS